MLIVVMLIKKRCMLDHYETKVLGTRIREQSLNGIHYVRSVRVLSILTDAINHQKLKVFWETNDINRYKDLLPLLQVIHENMTINLTKPCNKTFNLCIETFTELQKNFLEFSKDCDRQPAMCRCLNNILCMPHLLKNFVAADKTRD